MSHPELVFLNSYVHEQIYIVFSYHIFAFSAIRNMEREVIGIHFSISQWCVLLALDYTITFFSLCSQRHFQIFFMTSNRCQKTSQCPALRDGPMCISAEQPRSVLINHCGWLTATSSSGTILWSHTDTPAHQHRQSHSVYTHVYTSLMIIKVYF